MAKKLEINWDNLFEEYRNSGLNVKAFCELKSMHVNTFYQHRQKMNEYGMVRINPIKKCHPKKHLTLRFKDLTIEVNSVTDQKVLQNVLNLLGVI